MKLVIQAQPEDFPAWLELAAEVEPLFGPLVDESAFLNALRKNIIRASAYCVRRENGPPGAQLCGGLLFSYRLPVYTIGWLAVAGVCRRRGIGRRWVKHVIGLVEPPAVVVVTTFGPDHPEGEPARRFYEGLGFKAAEIAPAGPEGGSRQIFRREIGGE